MTGAAHLAGQGARSVPAPGMVRLGTPALGHDPMTPSRSVGRPLPAGAWAPDVLADLDRFHAVVVGPGLGTGETTADERAGASSPRRRCPTVVDGDGLVALAWSSEGPAKCCRAPEAPTVLTPHDGEFATARRGARAPIGSARPARCGRPARVVLLKGPTTVVAAPDGRVLVIADRRLALGHGGHAATFWRA